MKPYRSRKKKALHRALILAALILALSLTNAMNFLPRQALGDIMDKQNVSEMEVVRSFYDNKLKVYRCARQYLVEGKEAVVLCAVGFDPLMGWYDRDWCAVGTSDGNGLHIGYRGHQQGDAYSGYFFGRLDDEDIAHVAIWLEGEAVSWAVFGVEDTALEDAIFRGENGKRYLLCDLAALSASGVEVDREEMLYHNMTARAFDKDGKLLAEEEVHWHDWGTSDK